MQDCLSRGTQPESNSIEFARRLVALEEPQHLRPTRRFDVAQNETERRHHGLPELTPEQYSSFTDATAL